MLVARSAVGRACRPFRSRRNNNSSNNASVQASWSRSASEIAVIDRKGKARQIDEEDAQELQEQPSKEPLRLDLNAPSTSKLPPTINASSSFSSSSPPPEVMQRTISIRELASACRRTDSSRAWHIFSALTPEYRRDLPSSVLHELLHHQFRYSQHRDRRKDIEEGLEDESARDCWRRAGTILLYMKDITPEIKDTIRTIARKALEEIQASAELAMERYTQPGQRLIQTATGTYRARSLLLAHQRFCGSQSIEIYQKLLIFGISVDQELYDLITHLGDYIPRHESIPFPILRRAAQSILPLRSVEDGHKRQRYWPPKATNDLSEEEALLRKTILTGANAKQLFKLALETRDYLLAQYLYKYLRPSSVLTPSASPSSATSSASPSQESMPSVRRRAKRGDNRFLWTSDDTPYFISLFRSLAHDALHFRHFRSSKERLASLSSCSTLYEHWMKDFNPTPGVLKMEIAEVALAQIVHEYAEKMWSLLLKDQSFMFEISQLEMVVGKLKSWNNEDARQKTYIVAKKLLSPRSRYSPLISQRLYILLLETFAKVDLPEASSVEDGASSLKEATKPFEEVWAHMVKHGQPDLQAYNVNLQLRARTKEYGASIKLWENMLQSDSTPDRMAYNYVLKAYLGKGDPEGAQALVEQAASQGIVLKEQEGVTGVEQANEACRPEQAESTILITAALHEPGTESCKEHSSGMGFRIAAAPAEEVVKAKTEQHVAENEMDKPFLAAFFTSNDCSPPEDAPVTNTAAMNPEPADLCDSTDTEEESTFLAPALAFNRSPTISFPSFSLSQASPPSKLSESSIFASSARSPSSGSRNYHPANTWEAMLELAQAAREQLDHYACREQALQLADNRLRLERADMGRWSGWKEHHATPWY